ncbi:MAG: nucleotide exchange factor GrpE [Pirellulaceae bacterium]
MESAMNNDESLDPQQENTADDMPTADGDSVQQPVNETINDAGVEEGSNDAAAEDAEVISEPLTPEEELAEANARVLRITAEMENVRKRMQKEVFDARRYASTGLIRDLLGAIDNLGRAISAASDEERTGGIASGVEMVLQQLEQILEQQGCTKICPKGQVFDPNQHEAASQLPSDEFDAGLIMEVLQDGYVLHERVVRPAQVIISLGAIAEPDTLNPDADNADSEDLSGEEPPQI